jgi:N-acetylglutamate synthase-like GNAT family acetyltransferase
LVSADGEAVGTTTLRLLPTIGYMQGGAVVPARRGRGLYRAMLHHRLAVLRELGITHAVIWADVSSSAPIARAIGFEPRTRGLFYELRRD